MKYNDIQDNVEPSSCLERITMVAVVAAILIIVIVIAIKSVIA